MLRSSADELRLTIAERRLRAAVGQPSLALLLLECLHFYGSIFDAKKHAVGVGNGHLGIGGWMHEGNFVNRQHHALNEAALHPLVVCDPVNPENNAGKSCYRIAQVQAVFRQSVEAAVAAATAAVRDDGKVVGGAEAAILSAIFSPGSLKQ